MIEVIDFSVQDRQKNRLPKRDVGKECMIHSVSWIMLCKGWRSRQLSNQKTIKDNNHMSQGNKDQIL